MRCSRQLPAPRSPASAAASAAVAVAVAVAVAAIIAAAPSLSTLKVPTRLTATTFWKSASGYGVRSFATTRVAPPMPAQLTMIASGPSSPACSTAART
jgi:hypothetical protein